MRDAAVKLAPVLLALSLVPAFAQNNQPVVLQDVRLIDGTGAPPRDHMQVTIENGRIREIRSALLRVAFPSNARILKLSGKTILPGLINGHGHLGLVKGTAVSPVNYTRENIGHQLAQYERYGITTTVSLGLNKDLLDELRAEQHEGKFGGAAILSADRGLGSPGGMPPVAVGGDQLDRVGTPEEARKAVDEMAARHADLVKIWVDDNLGKLPKQKPEVYTAAIGQAHKRGLRVAAHLYYQSDAKQLLDAGVDIIAHSIRDSEIEPATIAAIKSRGVYYIPTLQLEEAFFIYAERPPWMSEPFFRRALSPALNAQLNSSEYKTKIENDAATVTHRQALRIAMTNAKKLYDAGALVAFGTDSGANPYRIQGFAEHRELELLVEAGIPPLAALHSATGLNTRMLHLDTETGTVEKGKRADLLVVNADPVSDITNTHRIALVFHNGKQVFPAGP
ncbi:MAG TPA: amidohydrolase family protein [Bryobacteraceae bacterium]